jgi:eukaryotic-like serine/threonine-protein kinase
MTSECWHRIKYLFAAALRLGPAEREPRLREACSTASWHPRVAAHRPELGPADGSSAVPAAAGGGGGFTPRPVIAPRTGESTCAEPPEIVRARLRELPMAFLLILAASALWMRAVLWHDVPMFYRVLAPVILALVGLIALLWSRWPIPLAGLKALELAMVGLLASQVAFIEYRVMLEFSLRSDTVMAQMTLKSVVLLTAVLILAYGLHVPKSWRRAAVVAGPLALLPFATLGVLALRHPAAMAWLWEGRRFSATPLVHFTFDALILVILAVGATFGARTIFRLRRQAAEARELGQYRLRERIGAGGLGEVYLAEHRLLKRPCAVKLIRPDIIAHPNALVRFEREVQITATLSHPNIVEIYDYGRSEDGTYYYVMEYLSGRDLEELVKHHGPLPPGRVVYLLRQVCLALRVAHTAGLIHRDIKPSNIVAARSSGMEDVAKLLDFGLVLPRAGSPAPHLTGEGRVVGTPQFMAPEQATGGRELDERSDVYALGAVAYYLLTGRPPFIGANGIGVMLAHAHDPVVPPSRRRADVPEDLERLVLRCLAKDPAERFQDAEGLERALGACACAADWDRERAARWWQDTDADHRQQGRPRESLCHHQPVNEQVEGSGVRERRTEPPSSLLPDTQPLTPDPASVASP